MIPINPLIIDSILIALLCLASAFGGYKYEKTDYDKFVEQVKSTGEHQNELSKAKDAELAKNAEITNNDTSVALNSIADYYKSNPVIKWMPITNTCSSRVSEVPNNPQSIDAASAVQYVSPYNPEDTEQVASQLDQLQKLLVSDGVTVK